MKIYSVENGKVCYDALKKSYITAIPKEKKNEKSKTSGYYGYKIQCGTKAGI